MLSRVIMMRRPLAASITLVALVLLGSAIPLHVAQLDTYAIHLWRLLDQTPHDQRDVVLVAAWPLLLIAGIAGILLGRALLAGDSVAPISIGRGRLGLWTPGLWGVAVLGPVALFALQRLDAEAFRGLWRMHGGALVTSLALASTVGGTITLLALATWVAARQRRNAAVVRTIVAITLATAVMPGVLVGLATSRSWSILADAAPTLAPLADSWAPIALAHVGRLAFIGVVAGVLLARAEAREQADLLRLDARGARAWWLAAGRPGLPALIAAGLVAMCLSLHEIESAVILEPASRTGGSWARVMLQQLHFNRTRELAAGVLIVFGICIIILSIAATLLRLWSASRPVRGDHNQPTEHHRATRT